MIDQILTIVRFVIDSFLHIWPYLLITIPLAVAVKISGASRYINRALRTRPLVAILLATFVGAFSPFCSCGVVPVIAALLISGVPLAPVMSFWIASPSMDPETFFLSVAMLGWELAVWRLLTTLALSLTAGFATHFFVQKGWLGQQVLRTQSEGSVRNRWLEQFRAFFKRRGVDGIRQRLAASLSPKWAVAGATPSSGTLCCPAGAYAADRQAVVLDSPVTLESAPKTNAADEAASCDSQCGAQPVPFWRRLLVETWEATAMVVKFMSLAFFVTALIELYVPADWIAGLLGRDNPYAILAAAVLGVPIYTSNMTALPMISGLLAQGMNPAAALAFLVAGPTTTLPAMTAVWGLATRRVFALYVSFSLVGAVIAGYVYTLVAGT